MGELRMILYQLLGQACSHKVLYAHPDHAAIGENTLARYDSSTTHTTHNNNAHLRTFHPLMHHILTQPLFHPHFFQSRN